MNEPRRGGKARYPRIVSFDSKPGVPSALQPVVYGGPEPVLGQAFGASRGPAATSRGRVANSRMQDWFMAGADQEMRFRDAFAATL